MSLFSVIIPANNEEGYIGACLDAVLAQDEVAGPLEVIVSANACTDRTVEIARAYADRFTGRGWSLRCLDRAAPGKVGALNAADDAASGTLRAYLDADVICEPALFGQLRAALARPEPCYATGRLAVVPPRSRVTRHYAALWQELPFMKGGAVGAGLFAVNAAGRALWGRFPEIISDDTFVRLQFTPEQRIEVPARYHWPMIEGWSGLVKVRRRQDAGVAEVYALHPELRANEKKARLGAGGAARLALRDPLGFAVYAGVSLAVRLRRGSGWVRGR